MSQHLRTLIVNLTQYIHPLLCKNILWAPEFATKKVRPHHFEKLKWF